VKPKAVLMILGACLLGAGLCAQSNSPVQYFYDDLGRLVKVVDQNGNVAGYQYDAVGNLLSITRSGVRKKVPDTLFPDTLFPPFSLILSGTRIVLLESALIWTTMIESYFTVRNPVGSDLQRTLTTEVPSLRRRLISALPLYNSTQRDPVEVPVLSRSVPSPVIPNQTRSRAFRQRLPSASAKRASTFRRPPSRAISLSSIRSARPHLFV
jgi:YD repeat-containing protein